MTFTWVPKIASEERFFPKIQPSEVLYDFDGPAIFISQQGLLKVLCYKTDESDSSAQYIVVPTNDSMLDKLKSGKISLRNAVYSPHIWVVEADNSFRVIKSWATSVGDIPIDLLPERGYGISPKHKVTLDTLSSRGEAYLSINFLGGQTTNRTLPFGVLKALFDEVYGAIWKIFSPGVQQAVPDEISEKRLRRALNIPTREPVFGSLLIEIEKPVLELDFRQQPDVDLTRVAKNIESSRDGFLRSAEAIVTAASSEGRLPRQILSDHYGAVDAVASLIPSSRSFFETLEINGRVHGRSQQVRIGRNSGEKIIEAYELYNAPIRTHKGKIVEISERSFSFIIKSHGREITCIAYSDPVRREIVSLRNGMIVSVKGTFQKRSRRDRIWIDVLEYNDKIIESPTAY